MQNIERRIVSLETDRAFGSVYEVPTPDLEAMMIDHFGRAPSTAELQALAGGGAPGSGS